MRAKSTKSHTTSSIAEIHHEKIDNFYCLLVVLGSEAFQREKNRETVIIEMGIEIQDQHAQIEKSAEV